MDETFFDKVTYNLLFKFFRLLRHSNYASANMTENILLEANAHKDISLFKRLKIYKKGYMIYTYKEMMRTKNESYFVPELKYFDLHPINGFASKWIDDKVTLRYVLEPFKSYLPQYYFHITNGKLLYLPDYDGEKNNKIEDIIKHLKKQKYLVNKHTDKSEGTGFEKLCYINNEFFINSIKVSQDQLFEHFSNTKNSYISEYIESCDMLKEIYPYTTNSLRVIVIRKDNVIHVVGAFLTFGTKASGSVDNIDKGGVSASVDIRTGVINPIGIGFDMEAMSYYKIDCHPDTKVQFKGRIEQWDDIVELINRIGEYLPHLVYLGYDFAVVNGGFKILEINSLQECINLNTYFGLEENKVATEFCKELLSKRKKSIFARTYD